MTIGTIVPIAPPVPPIGTIVTRHGGLTIPVTCPPVSWSLTAWRDFRDERVAIRMFDAGMTEADAVHAADVDCIAAWLQRHPAHPDAVTVWSGQGELFKLARVRDAVFVLEGLGVLSAVKLSV